MRSREAGAQPAFPPSVVVEIKRIACELPMDAGVPLARWSLADFRREVLARALVATISGTTLWRWLDADAIRPWRHRSWLFPRDPRFAEYADPILDLYARRCVGVHVELDSRCMRDAYICRAAIGGSGTRVWEWIETVAAWTSACHCGA